MKLYSVLVGGTEVNDYYFLKRSDAQTLAQGFIDDHYDDVMVVEVPQDTILEMFDNYA
jgi:hypothetical protein